MISSRLYGAGILYICIMCTNDTVFAAGNGAFKALTSTSSSNKAENYLGGSIGQSSADGFCASLQNCENSDKSWKLFAGIRMNENIVLEGGYVNFGEQTGQLAGNTVTQNASAFTAAAVAGYSMNEQIELFGKAGVARWSQEYTEAGNQSDSDGTDVLIGVGANYDLGDNTGIRAEWERIKDVGDATSKGDIDLLSVGVTFSSL